MPPRRYLEGFTLCVPQLDDGGGLVDCTLTKYLSVRAEASLVSDHDYDLIIQVEIRLTNPSKPGEDEMFATELHRLPFPVTRSERLARIRSVIAAPPLIPAG